MKESLKQTRRYDCRVNNADFVHLFVGMFRARVLLLLSQVIITVALTAIIAVVVAVSIS